MTGDSADQIRERKSTSEAAAASDAGHRRRGVLVNIQALRALAAILVVFVHLEAPLRQLGVGKHWQPLFLAGVDLFFVISGFIMVHTTAGRDIGPLAFLRLRILRVVPLYWLITLCAFATALAAPSLMAGTVADPVALFKSLVFLPFERADGLIRPILFVGWSLNLEMMFYAIFAATLLLHSAGARVVCGVATLIALVAIGTVAPEDRTLLRFITNPIILEFGLGMVIGLLYPRLPAALDVRAMTACAALVLIGSTLWIMMPAQAPIARVALPATALVFVAVLLDKCGWSLNNPAITAVGDASYALYLVHPFVTQTAILAAAAAGMLSPLVAVITIAAGLGGAIVLAVVVHRLVEKPLNRAAASWWRAP